MKRKTLLTICLLSFVAGCPPVSPRKELATAQKTFKATLDILDVLIEADKFNEDEIKAIQDYAVRGRNLLRKWTQAVINEEPVTFQVKFQAILDELIAYKLQGESR